MGFQSHAKYVHVILLWSSGSITETCGKDKYRHNLAIIRVGGHNVGSAKASPMLTAAANAIGIGGVATRPW